MTKSYAPPPGVTIVHVNRAVMAFNRKHRADLPVWIVRRGNTVRYCRTYAFNCPGRGRSADAEGIPPLACGARTWLEYDGEVRTQGETTWTALERMMQDRRPAMATA